jgi:histidinol-phosphate aminotransferase
LNNPLKPKVRSVLAQMKPYSPGKPIWEVQAQFGLAHVIKLASNENPLGPSPKAKDAMFHYLNEIHRYPDANAIKLREAIAAFHQINENEVIVGNGADELITLLSEAFLDETDEIIIPSPTFSEYEFAAHLMGVRIKSIPLEAGYQFNVDTILAAVNDHTKLIYLCSPNNPTGTYISKQELDKLFARLPRQIIVVLDCAYSHYAEAGDYTGGIEYMNKGFSIFILHTFSKIYGLAGIRVGYGIGSKEIIKAINQVKEPFNVNALAQTGALAALSDTEHVIRTKSLNAAGREQLYQAFDRLRIPYTRSMSNFILAEFGTNAKNIYESLMEKGIIVRYGAAWALPEHIRISIGTLNENEALIQALSEILRKSSYFT